MRLLVTVVKLVIYRIQLIKPHGGQRTETRLPPQ